MDVGKVEEILKSRGLVAKCRKIGDVISCGVRLGRNYEATVNIYGEQKIEAIVPNGMSIAIINHGKMLEDVAKLLDVPVDWVELGTGLQSADLILSSYDVNEETIDRIASALSKLRNAYVNAEVKEIRARIYRRIVPRFAPPLPRIR